MEQQIRFCTIAGKAAYQEPTWPEALDSSRILSFGDEHVDSPTSIAVVMEAMRLKGVGEFQLRENTNSSELGSSARAPVTSHICGYYR